MQGVDVEGVEFSAFSKSLHLSRGHPDDVCLICPLEFWERTVLGQMVVRGVPFDATVDSTNIWKIARGEVNVGSERR